MEPKDKALKIALRDKTNRNLLYEIQDSSPAD